MSRVTTTTDASGTLLDDGENDVLPEHAPGFGQTRNLVSTMAAEGGVAASATMTSSTLRATTIGYTKDVGLLPALRRTFAAAMQSASAAQASMYAGDDVTPALLNAKRLFEEIRSALTCIIAACLMRWTTSLEQLARKAATAPGSVCPLPAVKPLDALTADDLRNAADSLFEALQREIMLSVSAEAVGVTGDAIRLLLRCRAFIAQLDQRVEYLKQISTTHEHLAFMGPQPGVSRRGSLSYGGRGWDVTEGVPDVQPHTVVPRRGSVVSVFGGMSAAEDQDEALNPSERCAMALAAQDSAAIEGEFARLWEWERIQMPAEAAAARSAAQAEEGVWLDGERMLEDMNAKIKMRSSR
ncbi:MAG: hypothetical protein EOO41_05085, partial [Methanobacteriota archaeon]